MQTNKQTNKPFNCLNPNLYLRNPKVTIFLNKQHNNTTQQNMLAEEKFEDIDSAFLQLKNIRSSIYKTLGDIDQLCIESDQLKSDIIQEYVSEKERISSNQLNETDSATPFKSKPSINSNQKELAKIVVFPSKRREKNSRRKEVDVSSNSEIKYPNLFDR
jgi:hypothetical protein